MEEAPQPQVSPEPPSQPAVLYQPKHWHWPLWGGLFVVALLTGGFVFLNLKNTAPAETSQLSVATSTAQSFGEKIQLFYQEDDSESQYYKDNHYVYFRDKIIAGADPSTFIALSVAEAAGGNDNEWAKDLNNVYDFGDIVAGADPVTFTTVYNGVMKDKNYIWIYGGPSADSRSPFYGADPRTFSYVGERFYKDKDKVYSLNSKPLEGADPPTFVPLTHEYAKDKNYVYILLGQEFTIIQNADPQTYEFVEGQGYNAQDKNHKYLGAKIIE